MNPIPLDAYGYAPGYLIYPDGSVFSTRTRGPNKFLSVDYTGCVLLKTQAGSYVRRSTKILAFNVFTVPELLRSGYVAMFDNTLFINQNGCAYSAYTGEQLTPVLAHKYLYISVGRAGKDMLLHRLVAMAFIPNPDNLPEVDHINGNKLDNRACNLRWVTRSENMLNAYRLGALDDSIRKAVIASHRPK